MATWEGIIDTVKNGRYWDTLSDYQAVFSANDTFYPLALDSNDIVFAIGELAINNLGIDFFIPNSENADFNGDFIIGSIPVTQSSDGKRKGLTYCDSVPWGFYGRDKNTGALCESYATGGTGWISLGGAELPATVSSRIQNSSSFEWTAQSQSSIRFLFSSQPQISALRIFDVMGRELDQIRIAPEAQSIEYSTSRLSAGMYVATLDGNAVKFIVP